MLDVVGTRRALLDPTGMAVALVPQAELMGIAEQVGSNTPSLAGPEEILAEHFVALALGATHGSTDVLVRMRKLLNAYGRQ